MQVSTSRADLFQDGWKKEKKKPRPSHESKSGVSSIAVLQETSCVEKAASRMSKHSEDVHVEGDSSLCGATQDAAQNCSCHAAMLAGVGIMSCVVILVFSIAATRPRDLLQALCKAIMRSSLV